jgi:Holliday junction resolvase RusA-like endonuclease
MMKELCLMIPGKPIAKKRPRFARRGNFVTTYNDQQTEEGKFICLMQTQTKQHKPIPAGTAIYLNLYFLLPIPKGTSQKKIDSGLAHTKRPDLDNLIKFVKDCANGILWHDDSQVVSVEAHKYYGTEPATKIQIQW